MTEYTPLGRFRKFISRVSELATAFGDALQTRGFKPGGTNNQVPVKIGGTDFNWAWTTLTISYVSGLQTALDGKAALVHTHTISDVTGLQAALDGKADLDGATFSGPVVISQLNLAGLPTSDVGLVTGDLWNNSGTLEIVS